MPEGLNLGKKISVPKDVMMEELNLSTNRGSRMFLERQKRAERFTLENIANEVHNTSSVRLRAFWVEKMFSSYFRLAFARVKHHSTYWLATGQ